MITSATAPPLLVSQDDDLAAEITRLTAVAGCDLRRRADPAEAGQLWREAPLVLLDDRAAAHAAAAGMPRRAAILLVSRSQRAEQWRSAFEIGADAVLQLPEQEAQLVELLAEAVDAPVSGAGRVLAVLGGTGGAGASTLAAAVSVTAARRGDCALLLDCDPLGGGLDLTVGVERTHGLRWSGLAISGGRVAAGALREALPGQRIGSGVLTVLSCDRDGAASGLTAPSVQAVLSAGRRVGETVVCDLARDLSEPACAVLRAADLTVLVVPAQVRACAAAASRLRVLRERASAPVRLVVRGPAPAGLRVHDIELAVGAPVLAVLRTQAGLPGAVDKAGLCGTWAGSRGTTARAAAEVLETLDDQRTPERVAS